ncbi:MAG: hypothetical protein RR382_08680 [Tannerellaceae bacterium]
MGGLSMFLFKQGSRNSINNKRREESFSMIYHDHFNLRLPHQDSISQVLNHLSPEKLDEVKMNLMSDLFNQKCLRQFRLLDKHYLVAVDATGVVSFDYPHCEHCLQKKSKNGKVTYFHYVLEAKLVTAQGHCLSLASEWIENPEGNFDKQDCKQKAFARLAAKLKKQYPRLDICILADGLYPNNTIFNICENYQYKYIFVLQDKALKSVQQELLLTKRKDPSRTLYTVKDKQHITKEFRFQTDISYKEQSIHWLGCVKTRKKDTPSKDKSPQEPSHHNFEYVTNIPPTCENIIELAAAGRLRWKVENEGFNTKKCGDYELEHKYCRKSLNGLKNYYTLLQMAHAINQFIEKSTLVVGFLKRHSKETLRNIWNNMVAYMVMSGTTRS